MSECRCLLALQDPQVKSSEEQVKQTGRATNKNTPTVSPITEPLDRLPTV